MNNVRSDEPKKVTIEVNGRKVEMVEGPASGLEIKEAAVKQGVGIEVNFVLQQELPNGTGKVMRQRRQSRPSRPSEFHGHRAGR